MTDLAVGAVGAVGPHAATHVPLPRRHLRRERFGFWPRLATAAALTAVASAPTYVAAVGDALAGSRTAYVVVAPLLVLLVVVGLRTRAAVDVRDSRSDWILAILLGVPVCTGIAVLHHRSPAMAVLWHVDRLLPPVYFAMAMAVLFGVRYVARTWDVWAFALVCATPVPYLLAAAAVGGSDATTAMVTAILATTAVHLATRTAPPRDRILATMGNAVASSGAVVALTAVRAPLPWMVFVVGALFPLATVTLVTLVARVGGRRPRTFAPARRSPGHTSRASLVTLAVLAVLCGAVDSPPKPALVVDSAAAEWITLAGLERPVADYPAVTALIGPAGTLRRYEVPAYFGLPAAAIDVLTVPTLELLDGIGDAISYPTSGAVEHVPVDAPGLPRDTRAAHGATTVDGPWYALDWTWRADDVVQQVTVVVGQSADRLPPAPAVPSALDVGVQPLRSLVERSSAIPAPVDGDMASRALDVATWLTSQATCCQTGTAPAGI